MRHQRSPTSACPAPARRRRPQSPAPGNAITITLKPRGTLNLNNQPTTLENLATELAKLQRESPNAKVYLAPHTNTSSGELFTLMDTFAKAAPRDLRFLRKAEQPPTPQ